MTGPLTGYTVAVTAQRRGEELAALLGRRGAKTVWAPVLRMVSLPDDQALRAATVELINDPPDITIATTGIGFRGWLAAAEGWGLGEALHAALGNGRVWCRGPKALGAVRAAGLREEWSAPSECGWEVTGRLRGETLSGQRIAVQLHGDPSDDFTDTIRSGGGHAVPIPVYRWMLPVDITPVRRLVDQVCLRRIDAVTFTSAPAVNALLRIAGDQRAELLDALRAPAADGGVLAAVVGPVTAAPLERNDVPVVMPDRARLGSLARLVTAELPERAAKLTLASGHTVELRGHLVMVDGQVQPLPPAPMAILRALSAAKGKVLTRTELLRCLPRGCDRHAVEMAVTRLRDGLGLRSCVQTVIKRGYRLNLL